MEASRERAFSVALKPPSDSTLIMEVLLYIRGMTAQILRLLERKMKRKKAGKRTAEEWARSDELAARLARRIAERKAAEAQAGRRASS